MYHTGDCLGEATSELVNTALETASRVLDVMSDPARDDLPLLANTSHMLVKHYALDVDVDFENQVIEGTIVLFLEDGSGCKTLDARHSTMETCRPESGEAFPFRTPSPGPGLVTHSRTVSTKMAHNDFTICGKGEKATYDEDGNHGNRDQASETCSSKKYRCDTGNHGREDFWLILDCCDLSVLKVEEVDVAAVPGIESFTRSPRLATGSQELRKEIVRELVSLPAGRWREQFDCYARCSQAPGCGELLFATDAWSLRVRKRGAQTAPDFPHAIRIRYRTKPEGQSVTWTSDQSGRPCVYTMGSPINNRALFPCQEPPVAMSTWQATVRAAASFVVLMSGENSAKPTQIREGCSSWHYYVTMPMPASTFTIAVGCWTEVMPETRSLDDQPSQSPFPSSKADSRCAGVCGHMEYPCRFQNATATTQKVIPHRVFAPVCLKGACQETLLPLLPPCLSAAHSVLGTHPFSRLDVLIVPANFPSLGMASPHIIFLSQSTLAGRRQLCGTRLCHEIAHAWFGLAIGARDWTEEWLSEGFATHLEDVFWAMAQQLSPHEAQEQQELRACLRWQLLQDELRNSPEEMQVLRPSKEKTGHVSESGASVIKHGLNPEKIFLQVHYLKGYFLLRFLVKRLGDDTYFSFLRKFVYRFHGQLILSQDFLQMLLENIPEEKRPELSVEGIFQDWLETPGIPKPLQRELQAGEECGLVLQVGAEVSKWIQVNRRPRKRKRRANAEVFAKLLPDQLVLLLERLLELKTLSPHTLQSLQRTYRLQEQDAEVRHRWCELVVKHRHSRAYGQVERFLQEDQAMGVYLYGELMVSEDARQQQLARRCFQLAREQMDKSSAKVVAEMLF
ncbi:aminopeptidase O [Ochotona princeps]|uniref:aminopeptidase O n=1 Tax=Ochotona princeps TaxID=9978 RepID=UPI002714FF46|nr:aminopeptidase O [Ochotona princeps]